WFYSMLHKRVGLSLREEKKREFTEKNLRERESLRKEIKISMILSNSLCFSKDYQAIEGIYTSKTLILCSMFTSFKISVNSN
ncbi:hypothetical protein, partial [Staphylococcus aureus]